MSYMAVLMMTDAGDADTGLELFHGPPVPQVAGFICECLRFTSSICASCPGSRSSSCKHCQSCLTTRYPLHMLQVATASGWVGILTFTIV